MGREIKAQARRFPLNNTLFTCRTEENDTPRHLRRTTSNTSANDHDGRSHAGLDEEPPLPIVLWPSSHRSVDRVYRLPGSS